MLNFENLDKAVYGSAGAYDIPELPPVKDVPSVYFDKNNKKYKQVDTDHPHKINRKWVSPHTHKGYAHNEKGDYEVSEKEAKMVDRVQKTWYNYINSK